MSAQKWLDDIGEYVKQLGLEKAELEKVLFGVAGAVLRDHPEDIRGDDIGETVLAMLKDYSDLKAKIRKLKDDPDGAKIWALIEEGFIGQKDT